MTCYEEVLVELRCTDGSENKKLSALGFGCLQKIKAGVCIEGNLVFCTGILGYVETLTDPSYSGQVVISTFPESGIYGAPDSTETDAWGIERYLESPKIFMRAFIVQKLHDAAPSHRRSFESLSEFMCRHRTLGISGLDTRMLTILCRSGSVDMVSIYKRSLVRPRTFSVYQSNAGTPTLSGVDRIKMAQAWPHVVYEITLESGALCRRVFSFESTVPLSNHVEASADAFAVSVLVTNTGIKNNIVREVLNALSQQAAAHTQLRVVMVNYFRLADELREGVRDYLNLMQKSCQGVFIANGPGDPAADYPALISFVKDLLSVATIKSVYGVCLGCQVIALAAGMKTEKMPMGNRSHNAPVRESFDDARKRSSSYLTAQNHGFVVTHESVDALSEDWYVSHVNLNDGSVEGIKHKRNPWRAVQFHPEAAAGPNDSVAYFREFVDSLSGSATVVEALLDKPLSPEDDLYRADKVLLLGSGGLSIGQAGEFDYSGSQAIKALKDMNKKVILINPNVATVQTTPGMADKTYLLPLTLPFVEEVILRERPSSILCGVGGQTALNLSIAMSEAGTLAKYGVNVCGTQIDDINLTEDRKRFYDHMMTHGIPMPKMATANDLATARSEAKLIGYPLLVRLGYELGGKGSGFVHNEEELTAKLAGLGEEGGMQGPVSLDQSIKGWQEFEFEVLRDREGNVAVVCAMQNVDPTGVHTGDSIVVAPCLTLSNQDFQAMRSAAKRIAGLVGIVGECNVQFAFERLTGRYAVIEVNSRLSRSSALASKATGLPLAYLGTRLSMGCLLPDIINPVSGVTSALCEPSLDYFIVKVPRWDLQKFPEADADLGSTMKSVGEVMAIGRTFAETLQKAIRMAREDPSMGAEPFTALKILDISNFDLCMADPSNQETKQLIERLTVEMKQPTNARLFAVSLVLSLGLSIDEVHNLTQIEPYFLETLKSLGSLSRAIYSIGQQFAKSSATTDNVATLSSLVCAKTMREWKENGFSDDQIASIVNQAGTEASSVMTEFEVRQCRLFHSVRPFVKQIDTLAGEYPAHSSYLYMTYGAQEHDVEPISSAGGRNGVIFQDVKDRTRANSLEECDASTTGGTSESHGEDVRDKTALVLGCGCYRIGSSVEFDWSAVACVKAFREHNYKVIVVNCNPDTVSTDFDESDRLYFEEVSCERTADVVEFEESWGQSINGVVVSFGGQSANNIASPLKEFLPEVKILGTATESIERCEDRNQFSELCDVLEIAQPEWTSVFTAEEALRFATRVGLPVVVRPSFVLSGAAMSIVRSETELGDMIAAAVAISRGKAVTLSKFVANAKEVEIDAVADNGRLVVYALSEHVEYAGVHSGDASCIFPPQKIYLETARRIKRVAQKLAQSLNITGPFNVQLLCRGNEVSVIECNLRASRSLPFVSKASGVNFAEAAAMCMMGGAAFKAPDGVDLLCLGDTDRVCVKLPIFSFSRLASSDPRVGIEMKSTGEVAAFGKTLQEAFLTAYLATQFPLPERAVCISVGTVEAKVASVAVASKALALGLTVYATPGTYSVLATALKADADASRIRSVAKSRQFLDLITGNTISALIIVPHNETKTEERSVGFQARRLATDRGLPVFTDLKFARLLFESVKAMKDAEKEKQKFFTCLTINEIN